MEFIYNCLKNAQNFFLPNACAICDRQSDSGICSDCVRGLPENRSACPVCGEPDKNSLICGHCQQNPPAFDSTIAPYLYREPLSSLVQRMKYRADFATAAACGSLLGAKLGKLESTCLPEKLIPVPLHRRRLAQRGFNQAHELARVLSRKFSIPTETGLIERICDNPTQQGLSITERRLNIQGCFQIRRTTRAASVALVDDVMTTGSTLNEIAAVLKRSGVSRVECWVVARA